MKDNIINRFWAVLFYPGAAMEAVRDHPRWPEAGLLILLMVGVFAGSTVHITGPEQLELFRETRFGELMDEAEYQESYDAVLNPTLTDRLLQGLQAGVFVVVLQVAVGLIYLLFCRLAGGQGGFKQILGVTMWAGTVGLGLSSLITLPIVLAKGSAMDVVLGPAVLAAHRGPTDFWFQLLQLFDIFKIWTIVLVAIGFEKIHGFERSRAYGVSIGVSLLIGLVVFGFGRLFV